MRKYLIISVVLNLVFIIAGTLMLNHLLRSYSFHYILCKIRLGGCPYAGALESRLFYFQKGPKLKNAVIMLGDSLTELGHWNELFTRADIVNMGISGDTTFGLLNRLDQVENLRPRLVFLMIGTNDIMQGEPPEGVAARYDEILERFQKANIPVIAQTAPMISRHYGEDNVYAQRLAQVNHLVRKMCQLRGIKVVEVGPALSPGGFLPDAYTPDGVHINWVGYLIWRGQIASYMPPPLPQIELQTSDGKAPRFGPGRAWDSRPPPQAISS